MQIRNIKFINYKQFSSFSISCRQINVLVGPNNAGKSTVLDALRICFDVLRYARRKNPSFVSHDGHGVCPTYQIELSLISINVLHVIRNYGDDPAEIHFTHSNGNSLIVRIHPSQPLIAFLKNEGANVRNSTGFRKSFPLDIVVVPTLGPLESREVVVSDETVRRNENTRLAHRSFRNIIFRQTTEEFQDFSDLMAKSWKDISVQFPEVILDPSPTLEMFYVESRMTREVSTSGFGFQVWMQMMLQVMRGTADTILVLDEPDIYLHPDLQRRLLKLVRGRFGQIFIATHSSEIINELNPGDILSVDSKRPNARRVTTDDGYRELFKYIGSSENVEFARMARARRIIFFEGKDRRILRRLAQKISQSEILDDPDTVYLQAGGFGQWRRVTGVGWTLDSVFKMDIRVTALFDRDYRCDGEIAEFIENVSREGVRCRVLTRKEIENYALEYPSLIRLMTKKAASSGIDMDDIAAQKIIDIIIDEMKEMVKAQIIANILSYRKMRDPRIHNATILSDAMKQFDTDWADPSARLGLIPGKEFISSLSAKMHAICGQSVTIFQIINEMRENEIADDLRDIIRDFEDHFLS